MTDHMGRTLADAIKAAAKLKDELPHIVQVYRDENMRLHHEIEKLEAEVKKQRSLRDQYRAAWEAEKARAALGETE